MARTAGWACAGAGVAAGVLVCGEDFLFSLSLYLGARDAAALPLRPTDGFWLEVSAAAGDHESGSHGDRRRLVGEGSCRLPMTAQGNWLRPSHLEVACYRELGA